MKEYYFLSGKNQNGPYSIEELKTKQLTQETLIWTEGMGNWQRISDFPELVQVLWPGPKPPPPPSHFGGIEHANNNETLDKQLKEDAHKHAISSNKPPNYVLKWLIVWSALHLFALIMSYSQVPIFNVEKSETSQLWPFVKFVYQYEELNERGREWRSAAKIGSSIANSVIYDKKTGFNGLFYGYDWSEFSFYVGGALVIFILYGMSKRNKLSSLN